MFSRSFRNSLQVIWAVIQKESVHIRRDKRTLRLIIFMPLMQLIIYGYGINTDVKHMSTVLLDLDQTPLSRRFAQALEQSHYFTITQRALTRGDVALAIDRGQAKVGVLIPPRFGANLIAGRGAQVQFLIDGTDSNPANTAINTGQAVVSSFVQREKLVPIQTLPIDFRPRLWYNPDLKSAYFMVPGVVGLLLQFLIPMITASAVVREKERGNIEQLLVSPIKPYQLMLGKMVPYVGIGCVIMVTVLTVAHLLFHVPIRGNLVTLLVLTLLFITVCLGFGLFASTIAENQQQASQIIMLFAAPSILLSGFIFPRETMPLPIFLLGYIIPLTYFLQIIRGVVLKGLGFADLWPQILPLVAIAALILFVSVRKFHKRIS